MKTARIWQIVSNVLFWFAMAHLFAFLVTRADWWREGYLLISLAWLTARVGWIEARIGQ